MSMSEAFGEIRGLLERRPSAATFDVVTQRLEAAAREDDEQVRHTLLPYVEDKLERWPDVVRLCPRRRLEDYESGQPIWCHLVRALDYEGVSIKRSRLDEILQAPNAPQIKHLDIRSANMKWDQIDKLVHEAPFRLDSFGFRRVSNFDWSVIEALFASEMLSGVERLNFRGWDKIKADVYEHLIAHFPLENLRAIDVSGGAMSTRNLKALLKTGRIDSLEEFRAGAWVSEKTTNGMIGELAKHEAMQGLRVLEVRDVKPKDLELLAHAEHLSSSRELGIDWIGEREIEPLCEALAAPSLTGLESLSLWVDEFLWHTTLDAITNAPLLDGLRALKLGTTDYDLEEGQSAFERFLKSGRLGSMQRLSMMLTPSMLDLMAEHASALPEIEQLHLTVYNLGGQESAQHMKRLFEEIRFPELRTLTLSSSNGAPSMSLVLDAIRDTAQLETIEALRVQEASAEDLARFLECASLSGLRRLDISSYYYGSIDPIYSALLSAEHFGNLEAIVVDANNRLNALLAQMEAASHHLPEFLHIGYPEYAQLQMSDWM